MAGARSIASTRSPTDWSDRSAAPRRSTYSTTADDGSYTDPKGATAASYLRLDSAWYPANPNGGGSNFVNYLYRLDPSDGTIDNMMSRVDDIETTGVNDLMFRYLGASTLATEDLADLDIELDYSPPSSTSTATNSAPGTASAACGTSSGPAMGASGPLLGPPTPTRTTSPIPRPGRQRDEQGQPAEHQLQPDLYLRCPQSPHLQQRGDGLANQTWGLDGVGNMATVTMTSSTPQSRTVNAANEIAASSGIVTPLYDAAGKRSTGQRAVQGQQATPVHCVYDAEPPGGGLCRQRSGGLGAEIARYQYTA